MKRGIKKSGIQSRSGDHPYVRLWQSRGFVVGLLVVVIFISVSVTQEVVRRLETNYEIDKLEKEVARLGGRNAQLAQAIQLFNTSSFQEKEAREKLNAQKPGEHVVLFPKKPGETEIVLPDSDKIEYIPIRDYRSNPEKWFYYFWDNMTNSNNI